MVRCRGGSKLTARPRWGLLLVTIVPERAMPSLPRSRQVQLELLTYGDRVAQGQTGDNEQAASLSWKRQILRTRGANSSSRWSVVSAGPGKDYRTILEGGLRLHLEI
ncbi:hypothetical protein [Desulfosporosinus sp. SB140]|uniref:hypothetical protein n=1 Tax=Desulfosporosinus paludis TaxID=3115649 RepID=UPI00388D6AB9